MNIRFAQTRRNHWAYYVDRLWEKKVKYSYMVDAFYQTRPEDKEKLKWIHKLDTILSIVTTAWNKIIIIAEDTISAIKNYQMYLKNTKK